MLGDRVGDILTLENALRYWSSKLVKNLSFGFKVPLWGVLTGKWKLR